MTKFLPIAAAALLATGAQAADSYRQFTAGNPDIGSSRTGYEGVTAVQPGIGADVDRYHGIGDGNPDLFAIELEGVDTDADRSERPDIYGPFGASPDLSY
jgi:hypothetical protein